MICGIADERKRGFAVSDESSNIIDKLISDIESGVYGPHDRLPSENEAAGWFRVPRNTVRLAYSRLQELGYIYSMQGKGSFVRDRCQQIPLMLSADRSFSKKMTELGYNYRSETILCEKIAYHPQIYSELGAAPEEAVYRIGRLRFIDDRPIAMHTSCVRQSVFPRIREEGPLITSMFEYYQSKGFRTDASAPSTLTVMFPSKQEREWLECSSLIPILVLESSCREKESGLVLETTRILYKSDSFTYVI